jgi:hypothetical protein
MREEKLGDVNVKSRVGQTERGVVGTSTKPPDAASIKGVRPLCYTHKKDTTGQTQNKINLNANFVISLQI